MSCDRSLLIPGVILGNLSVRPPGTTRTSSSTWLGRSPKLHCGRGSADLLQFEANITGRVARGSKKRKKKKNNFSIKEGVEAFKNQRFVIKRQSWHRVRHSGCNIPRRHFAAGAEETSATTRIRGGQMVLCTDHNNADYLIKLTLSSRGKHILWVQIQNSDALSIHGARRTCADAPLGCGSVLDSWLHLIQHVKHVRQMISL